MTPVKQKNINIITVVGRVGAGKADTTVRL